MVRIEGGDSMKKAIFILILTAMLTGCGNSAKEETAETAPAFSQETVSTVTAVTSASLSETETILSTAETSHTAAAETTVGKNSTSVTTRSSVTAAADTDEPKAPASESSSSMSSVTQSISEYAPTQTKQISVIEKQTAAETKKSKSETAPAVIGTTASELPAQTSAQQKTAAATKAITTTAAEEGEVIYVEIEDVTCLATMVENLEETDTPPSYYEKVGKGLKHDGTDYGKAAAVYKWMRENGWGSCVYYSMETYFVCKGAGLECAYAFATDNGWYGHTYNTVKVNGTWYVMDTQGRSFLDNNEYCTKMFDGNDKDLTPFKRWIWYDYDENGDYRDWSISD